MLTTECINTLEDTIVISSLLSSKIVSDQFVEVTGEDQMSWQLNYALRLEMLYFFLHVMSRYAFEISQEVRNTIQDELVPRTIQKLIKTSFDKSGVKNEVNITGLDAKIINNALEDYNNAEDDYRLCKRLGVEDKIGSSSEDTIINKLALRLSRLLGIDFDIDFEFLVWKAIVEPLAKSTLREQVRKIVGQW